MSMSDVIAARRAQAAYDKWAAANPSMVTAYQATPEGRFALSTGARDSAITPQALTGMYQQTGGDVNKISSGMRGDLATNYPTLFQPSDSGGLMGGLGSFYSSLGVAAPILLGMAGANAMGAFGDVAGAAGGAGSGAGGLSGGSMWSPASNAFTTGEFVPQAAGAMDYLKTAQNVMGTLNMANNLLGGGQNQTQQPQQQYQSQPAQQGLNPMAVGAFGAKNLGYANGGLAQLSRRI